MKVKDGFYLTAIGTDFVIIASTPETKKEFDGMLRLNETGAFLWKKLTDGASETELADALAAEYGVYEKSIARNISEIRCFLAENRELASHAELIYDRSQKCYTLYLRI